MDLRQFVSKALLDIVSAVKDAQEQLPAGVIIPRVSTSFQAVETGISDVQSVEFEVTVTTDERAGKEAKLSVVAAIVGGGVKGETGTSAGHAGRLKFRVPLRFPRPADVEKKA